MCLCVPTSLCVCHDLEVRGQFCEVSLSIHLWVSRIEFITFYLLSHLCSPNILFFNLWCGCVSVGVLLGGKCLCVYFRVEVRGQLLRVGSFLHLVASEFEHRLLGLFRYLSWLNLSPYHLFKLNSHWVSRSLVNFLSSYFGNGSHGGFFAFI